MQVKRTSSSAAQSTEFLLRQASRARADYPTFDKWYRKKHKKFYPITVTGMPAEYGRSDLGKWESLHALILHDAVNMLLSAIM